MVKGLKETTGEGALLDAFAAFGQVKEIRLVKDRETKISRGFAFIEFHSQSAAKAAVDAPSPIYVDDSSVRVTFARDIKGGGNPFAPPSSGNNDGSGNSGYEFAQEQAASHLGPKRAGFGNARAPVCGHGATPFPPMKPCRRDIMRLRPTVPAPLVPLCGSRHPQWLPAGRRVRHVLLI